MPHPTRRRPPGLVESMLVVARSWTGAAFIAALAVVGTGSCRSDEPTPAGEASSGRHHVSPDRTAPPD